MAGLKDLCASSRSRSLRPTSVRIFPKSLETLVIRLPGDFGNMVVSFNWQQGKNFEV
jgi:hypothetical protein